MDIKLPFGYLSVSQVRQYLRCPQQYEFQYIHRLKAPTSPALIMGTAFHGAMEKANREKMLTGEILSTDDVKDAYNDAWNNDLKYRDGVEWDEADPQEVKDKGIGMTAFYYENEGRKHLPAYVEVDHTFPINTKSGEIKFRSKIDLIEIDGMVRDYKTASKSPSKDKADNDIQLPIYALAYRDLTGEKEMGASLETVVGLKKEIKITQLTTTISDQRISRVQDLVEGVAKSISAGIFYPNDEAMACSWCAFRKECKTYIGK
jgi:putative RecB family exonuclease